MEKDTYRSQFRLPQGLYEKLKAAADERNVSVNAELVSRLNQSFENASAIKDAEDARLKQQITILRSVLRNAAGIIRSALISGRHGKIPEADVKWMSDEANHFSNIAADDQINLKDGGQP